MRVVLTGGGTGGHVIPNFAVIEELKKQKKTEILYIGSANGVEKSMVEKIGIPYKSVACGKLRRYFSIDNLIDIFKVPVGIFQAWRILKKWKPDVVFSKGGFVSVPVVIAASWMGVMVIIHESDVRPGLANRICARYADKICVSFEETKKYLHKWARKIIFTGNPVRKSIMDGEAENGYKFTGLDKHRPVILVMGGSQGAQQINELVRGGMNELLKRFQIVHICGRGNLDMSLHKKGYVQYEFLNEQMKDVYSISELVISRGGANSLAEIAALKKKALVIPLGTAASRGDQIENAQIFSRKLGWGVMVGDVQVEDFIKAVEMVNRNKLNKTEKFKNGVYDIVKLILKAGK